MPALHVSLRVGELGESVRFHRGLFGEPKKLEADGNRWEIDTVIEDIEATTPEAPPACSAR